MSEFVKRVLSGVLYVFVLWTGTSYSQVSFGILFIVLGSICLFEMWILRKGKNKIIPFIYVLTPFFIVQLFGFTDHNYTEIEFDSSPILILFLLTWIFDSFAYIIGSKFGKNKIMPKISPKKSWEGFIGGTVSTVLSVYFINQFFDSFTINFLILLALIVPFTATAGDFIESHYKREAGVKDSGNLIPGHGGFLDRMDAMLISIPVLYLLINIFK
jgi:phosphatidate cytidylyltransferase